MKTRISFHDGNSIPQLGLGTWQLKNGIEAEDAVFDALKLGYRHIDTASVYGNEESVGKALKKSRVPREDFFITTKLWNDDHDDPGAALEASLKRLGLSYVDLYLIHWPVPARNETWKVFQTLVRDGLVRSIGVSNFTIRHLKALPGPKPVINQVEFNPFLHQAELHEYCIKNGIVLEAYSPLSHGKTLKDKKLGELAGKYKRSPAQILIRWAIQKGIVVIPKSRNKERIKENAAAYDFSLSGEDMELLNSFNKNLRTCWDPTNMP